MQGALQGLHEVATQVVGFGQSPHKPRLLRQLLSLLHCTACKPGNTHIWSMLKAGQHMLTKTSNRTKGICKAISSMCLVGGTSERKCS